MVDKYSTTLLIPNHPPSLSSTFMFFLSQCAKSSLKMKMKINFKKKKKIRKFLKGHFKESWSVSRFCVSQLLMGIGVTLECGWLGQGWLGAGLCVHAPFSEPRFYLACVCCHNL